MTFLFFIFLLWLPIITPKPCEGFDIFHHSWFPSSQMCQFIHLLPQCFISSLTARLLSVHYSLNALSHICTCGKPPSGGAAKLGPLLFMLTAMPHSDSISHTHTKARERERMWLIRPAIQLKVFVTFRPSHFNSLLISVFPLFENDPHSQPVICTYKVPEYKWTVRKLDFNASHCLIPVNPLCANFPRDPFFVFDIYWGFQCCRICCVGVCVWVGVCGCVCKAA